MLEQWLNPVTWSADKYILLQGDASNLECHELVIGEGLIEPDGWEWDAHIERIWVKWADQWHVAVEHARTNEDGAFWRTVIRLKLKRGAA